MLPIIKAVYYKNRQIVLRAYPYSFMIQRILGGIFAIALQMIMYYFVFNGNMETQFEQYVGSSDYVSYIVLGQMLNVLSFATLMNVGRCLISEIREGTIDNFILSPASRIGYFVGSYIEQLGRSFVEYMIMLLLGFVLGMRLSVVMIVKCLFILIIASLAFFSVAILVSTIMIYTRDTYLVQNTVFIFMELVCGVFYPVEYMPCYLQCISKCFPLTPVLILFRRCILLEQTISQNWSLLLHIFLLSLCYVVLGYWGYKKVEKKLIEEVLA